MSYHYIVTDKTKSPDTIATVVTAQFVNDDKPELVFEGRCSAVGLDAKSVDLWAAQYIIALDARDVDFETIVEGVPLTPKPLPTDPLETTRLAFAAAIQTAEIRKYDDPDVTAAFEALKLAKEAAAEPSANG